MRVVGLVLSFVLAVGAPLLAKESSTTKVTDVTVYEASYAFQATLSPAHPENKMRFTLFKKKSGDWVKVSSKSFAQSGEADGKGYYNTGSAFVRVSASRCKVVAKFAGDADHAASKDAEAFDC